MRYLKILLFATLATVLLFAVSIKVATDWSYSEVYTRLQTVQNGVPDAIVALMACLAAFFMLFIIIHDVWSEPITTPIN